jgi:hypothetical protein
MGDGRGASARHVVIAVLSNPPRSAQHTRMGHTQTTLSFIGQVVCGPLSLAISGAIVSTLLAILTGSVESIPPATAPCSCLSSSYCSGVCAPAPSPLARATSLATRGRHSAATPVSISTRTASTAASAVDGAQWLVTSAVTACADVRTGPSAVDPSAPTCRRTTSTVGCATVL